MTLPCFRTSVRSFAILAVVLILHTLGAAIQHHVHDELLARRQLGEPSQKPLASIGVWWVLANTRVIGARISANSRRTVRCTSASRLRACASFASSMASRIALIPFHRGTKPFTQCLHIDIGAGSVAIFVDHESEGELHHTPIDVGGPPLRLIGHCAIFLCR